MTKKKQPSSEWTAEAVVGRLRERTSKGNPSSMQVFVKAEVRSADLPAKAKEIVESASKSLGLAPGSVRLGKVHRLANSFSVTSDQPQVFETIARRDEVKSVLESEQPDILPKPL